MTRVMAQGTFDLLHPGHLHYLRESRDLGDELYVVISRDSRVKGEKDIVMGEEVRREVVDALETVDKALLGSEGSIFDSVEKVQPDVVTLGYDQDFDEEELEQRLEKEGFEGIEVVRIERDKTGISSSEIRGKLR